MLELPVAYRPEALDDFDDIFRYVLQGSRNIDTAEGFVQRIKARCERIGNSPSCGRPRTDLEPGLRTVPFEHSAVIAYKVEFDCVRITNIFFGGRDYEALYRGHEDDME